MPSKQQYAWFDAVASAGGAATTQCSAGTRPPAIALTLSGIVANEGTTAAEYIFDDWAEVRDRLNGEHVLERLPGSDAYQRTFSVDVGTSPIDVTLDYEYRAADHQVVITADPQAAGVTTSSETQTKTGLSAPYNCTSTLGTGFANVSTTGPDAAEGGLTFSSLSIASAEYDVGNPTGTKFYEITINDLTQAQWDAYFTSLPIGSQGRRYGRNHIYLQHNTSATYQPYRLRANENYEVPTLTTMAGIKVLRCDRSLVPNQNHHSQVVPSSVYPQFEDVKYLKPLRDYRFEFVMVFDPLDFTFAQWAAHPWAILLDFHPGTFPAGWIDTTEPLIALSVEGGTFRLRTRGSSHTFPGFYTRNDQDNWPLSMGEQHFILETRFDYTGATGYTRLWSGPCPGTCSLRAQRTGSVGFNHSAATTPGSMFPKFGCYTSTDGPVTYLKSITIYDQT